MTRAVMYPVDSGSVRSPDFVDPGQLGPQRSGPRRTALDRLP